VKKRNLVTSSGEEDAWGCLLNWEKEAFHRFIADFQSKTFDTGKAAKKHTEGGGEEE